MRPSEHEVAIDLREVVRNAAEASLFDLNALIVEANALAPLPASSSRLSAMLTNDDWNVADVERVIALDQALTLRMLRMANSALSGSEKQIVSVREAVVRMGTGAVLSVAVASGAQRELKRSIPEYHIAEGELWKHSVASALATETLSQFCGPLPTEAFVSALLHDIGKLVLGRFLDPELLAFLKAAREQGDQSSMAAELEILGVHHGELGGIVAQHWNLPERIVKGIIYHHTPDDANDSIADIVHVADAAAKRLGAGTVQNEHDREVHGPSLSRLCLSTHAFDTLCELVRGRLEEVVEGYG